MKEKFTGQGSHVKVGARLAAGGNRQPADSYFDTFAPTIDEPIDKLVIAAFFVDAVKRGYVGDMVMCALMSPVHF